MQRIRIERPITGLDATYGAAVTSWALVAVLWAEVQDVPPSRSEALRSGVLPVAKDQARVRIRRRDDLDGTMRVIINRPDPVTFQIIGGPVQIEQGYRTELMIERYSSNG